MSLVTHINRRSRLALVAALATLPLALAATASADNFSRYTGQGNAPLTKSYSYDGCIITVGPVQDPSGGTSNYRTIAGLQVHYCSSRHTISATVAERASNGPSVWQVGGERSTTFYNAHGFGNSILEDNLGCVGTGYYWQTAAYVSIDGHSPGWLYSPWSNWKSGGC
jgi:hypothetical protein